MAFKEFRALFGKSRATQEIVTDSFKFGITKAKWINSTENYGEIYVHSGDQY